MIGVLMSATLPARLGEPSRALIVARRLGRMRDRFPVVLGTLVSQTLLNILALAVLGAVMFATVGLFQRRRGRARDRHDRAGRRCSRSCCRRPGSAAPRQAVALPARAAGGRGRARAMVQVRRGLQVFRRPRLGAWAALDAAHRLGDPVARLLRAARGARPRRARRHRRRRGRPVRGQRHRRAAGHAVEPRRLPGRLRRGAVRLRRGQDRRASPTGSSCRRSRSRPRSRWACRRWCARA